MIRFGVLCSPALRIHTLVPVSFPLQRAAGLQHLRSSQAGV